ncbi:hypothetical protein [Paenibacillus eucommiae]|uniref:Uncharacterized protein n=1 Tax=Paenibacillus eucommiae TaxID=1355755 RepID=A0ABS4J1R7_9BACL|nr:hypothetical protein [Paenibacillus eucommiae]MBP1993784.1 hypothetical protein [Paenibacillus eucommiae]
MSNAANSQTWQGEIIRAAIPPCRDPFINTFLLPLGPGEDGEERFWISSWNGKSGSMGVLVTESGKERVYRFSPPNYGFYSAAQEDQDTLWLCGDLSKVVRLTLSTGAIEEYDTGAPSALVFQGMAIDHKTGKLFAAAYPESRTAGFSFDYLNRRPVKVYPDTCKELYMCSSFPAGEGTHCVVIYNPGISVLHWDPLAEEMEAVSLMELAGDQQAPLSKSYGISRLIRNDEGQCYFPDRGWYNPITRSLTREGPRPEEEMTWFAVSGHLAWGASYDANHMKVGLWDMNQGQVAIICTIPDCTAGSVNLTADRKIVAVNLYGEFYRYDGLTGVLELFRSLPTDSIAEVDCLRRIDKDRLLGTPFITQRFWEINLQTGEGKDFGRAAPGVGEILQTWKLGEKIYMAAYTESELVEYDPGKRACFPENPRVVAKPPGGMRPVAAADRGSILFYASSHYYGKLGCTLTKYDTATGVALYNDDPLPGQTMRSLCPDNSTESLLAGTTMCADVNSCVPVSSLCYFARIDIDDLSVIETIAAPPGTKLATVHGPIGVGEYLCSVTGDFPENAGYWFILSVDNFSVPELDQMQPLPPHMQKLIPTDIPGLFVFHIHDQIELWDMRGRPSMQVLYKDPDVYHCHSEGASVYLVKSKEILILENCLVN